MKLSALMFVLNGYRVRRYHTTPTIQTQTVGDHTAGVIAIAEYLMGDGGYEYEKELALLHKYILRHDVAEQVTGDVPAPVKWAFGELRSALASVENEIMEGQDLALSLDKHQYKIAQLADMFELVIFCYSEISMGNRSMADIAYRGLHWLNINLFPAPKDLLAGEPSRYSRATELYHHLKGAVNELCK